MMNLCINIIIHINSNTMQASLILPRIVIITGAGVSASANIPTYRTKQNQWCSQPITNMQTICTKGSHFAPESIAFYDQFRTLCRKANPTPFHHWCADMQSQYGEHRFTIYTQNIDDLFERSNAIATHVHGSIEHVRCITCNSVYKFGTLLCANCDQILRNDVVFYGESGHYERMIDDITNLDKNDLFMLIGTSCEAINIDLIMRPINCIKIYVNPVIEPAVNIRKYTHTLYTTSDNACDDLTILCQKYM